jgi:hypothetical protein
LPSILKMMAIDKSSSVVSSNTLFVAHSLLISLCWSFCCPP